MLKLVTDTVRDGILEHSKEVMDKKNYNPDDVEAGQEYVKGYVEFVHYVERIYESAKKPAEGHYPESEAGGGHKE